MKAMMKEAGKTMGEAIDIDEDELDDSSYQEAKVKAAKVIRNEKLAVHDKKKQARGGAKKNKPRYKILSFKR